MAARDDEAAASPPALPAETPHDADSLLVHPGSPRSPPPLSSRTSPLPPQPPNSPPSNPSSGTEETDLKADRDAPEDPTGGDNDEKQQPPEPPQPRFTIDPDGELTFDETTVDVVTVPCPGGHPLRSWTRDGLLGRYFGAPSMRDTTTGAKAESGTGSGSGTGQSQDDRGPSWVRQGIRREASRARILLYEHPSVDAEGTTLGSLADCLLRELAALRAREDQGEGEGRGQAQRPLVFVGHSLGGLVVKMALCKASRDARYEGIARECYGVAFFGTPHQGSSYFAMPSLATSIQALLQLSAPLPASITDDLRVGNSLLLHVDEDFKSVSSDVQVWTFYETIDSRLSGGNSNVSKDKDGDVYFTAPLTSIKSAILGMRQESIFPLQSDHANIASFGRHNVHTLRLFLRQLAACINHADAVSKDADAGRWTLGLEQKVNVEVHGFFDDPPLPPQLGGDAAVNVVRAWSTRLPLKEFLAKGPEACLSERLNEVDGAPEESRFLRSRGRTSLIERQQEQTEMPFAAPEPLTIKNALGIQDRTAAARQTDGISVQCPSGGGQGHWRRKQCRQHAAVEGHVTPTRHSTPLMGRSSALIRADFDQDLAVDRLSPPMRPRVGRSVSRSFSLGSDRSPIEYKDFPPFSQRSRSTVDAIMGGSAYSDDGEDEDGLEASPRLPDAVVAIRKAVQGARGRVTETVVVDEVPVAFVRPDVKARRFVWVHVPFNNPTWVKDVLQTLEVSYKRDYSSLYSHDFWATRHTRGRHAQHYAYFAKPGCYFTAPRTLSPRPSLASPALSPAVTQDSLCTCLFLPYLHFDSYKRLIRRREVILRRLGHGRSRPVPELVAKSDSLELQVVWEYLGHDPPINCRRTLDQYGYPSLRDTRSRDDDQMLYKLTKERPCGPDQDGRTGVYAQWSTTGSGGSSEKDAGQSSAASGWRERLTGRGQADNDAEEDSLLNGNVLMVDQLWLWVIHSHTVVSFFPSCENALDLAALAALHAVSVLLDRSSHPDLEVFRIFEEAISVLTERLTQSLKEFRTVGFRDKAFDYEPVENKARSIRARHKEEGQRAEQENRDNTSALLELRDIEDELLTLLHLFERQSKVVSTMHATYARPELREHTANGRVFLSEALKRLREYGQQADEMIARVRSTRDDYDKLLQMVQRQAQVDEVRLSRLHADLASAQSRSVMIFTTFTVIFLPLTFFTGLFGMNTQEWGGENNLSLKTIGAIALPASFVLVVGSLVVAFSTNARTVFRWLGRAYGRGPVGCRGRKGEDGDGGDAGKDARRGRRGGAGARRRAALQKEASDFWERHRLERERGYHIPQDSAMLNHERTLLRNDGTIWGWTLCHARERLPLLTDARFVPSWLATPACFLVSFFAEALDAARSRAAVAELLAGVGALMSVATAESARACNERVASRVGRGVIARPTGWWLLFNLIGGALVWQVVIVPAFLHRARLWFAGGSRADGESEDPMGVTPERQQQQQEEEEEEKMDTDRSVADAEIVAIPLAVALGFYVPSVAMLTLRSPGAIAAWLPFPVYVSLLRQGVRWAVGRFRRSIPGRVHIEYVSRSQRRSRSHDDIDTNNTAGNTGGGGRGRSRKRTNKPLAALYGLPALASVAAHALLAANLAAGRDDRREMTRSTVKFLEVDAQYLALTVLYWVFAEVGWRAPATMLLVGAVFGPGAGVCAGWVVRERLLRESAAAAGPGR
ncbi:hypothetical protein ACCO45_007394 [Purpureocillium lilacinum]|uniref:Uncharacterized protein n=1 Tax=Purpureocillium lilacinum TaxID=33203 RepID=A0ACC4DT32_PURLI